MKNDAERPRVVAVRLRAMLVLGLGLAAGTAFAAGACTATTTGMAFGAYQPITFAGKLTSGDRPSTATVSIVCTGIAAGGTYAIALGAGNYGPGDRTSSRYLNNMTNGGDFMQFNVYRDAAYSMVWGSTTGMTLSGIIPIGNSNQSQTVYGKVAAGQTTLKAGSYSDSLVMTITYNP